MSAQEERGILIVVSPLIGDTVYAQQEAIYHLFPDVDGFRWAKYYMLPDSEVYAIVNYIPFASETVLNGIPLSACDQCAPLSLEMKIPRYRILKNSLRRTHCMWNFLAMAVYTH